MNYPKTIEFFRKAVSYDKLIFLLNFMTHLISVVNWYILLIQMTFLKSIRKHWSWTFLTRCGVTSISIGFISVNCQWSWMFLMRCGVTSILTGFISVNWHWSWMFLTRCRATSISTGFISVNYQWPRNIISRPRPAPNVRWCDIFIARTSETFTTIVIKWIIRDYWCLNWVYLVVKMPNLVNIDFYTCTLWDHNAKFLITAYRSNSWVPND